MRGHNIWYSISKNIQSQMFNIIQSDVVLHLYVFSSHEHEVLMVSYCDQSMSVVRRPSCVVRRQQFVLKANSS